MGNEKNLIAFDGRTGPSISVESVVVGAELHLVFKLSPLKDLWIPSPEPAPAYTEGLWEDTCFEAFIQADGDLPYLEWNFAPSGNWAVLAFSEYRRPKSVVDRTLLQPKLTITANSTGLELRARLSLRAITSALRGTNFCLGLSAVLRHQSGECSYWALMHPDPKPDFHSAAGFALRFKSSNDTAS